MPLPISPTLLLAAGGLAIVVGRYLSLRVRGFWHWYFVVSALMSAIGLWCDPIAAAGSIGESGANSPWINDSLAVAEQWLILAFGLLSGVALFESNSCVGKSSSRDYGFLLFIIAGLMLVAQSNDSLALGLSLEVFGLAIIALRHNADSRLEKTSSQISEFSQNGLASDGTLSSNSLSMLNDDATGGIGGRPLSHVWLRWIMSAWMWFGIALLANALKTTQFDEMRRHLFEACDPRNEELVIGSPSKMVLLAVGLIAVSFFARMGLIPFHLGIADFRQPESVRQNGISMLAGQLAGSIALTRLCGCVFVGIGRPLTVLMIVVSLLTFLYVGVKAVRSLVSGVRSIPSLISCLMQFQSAWLCVGFMTLIAELGYPEARWAKISDQTETLGLIVFSQCAGLLACGGVLWVISHLARADRSVEFLEDVKGLAQFAPGAGLVLVVCLTSSLGAPWTAGGISRLLLVLASQSVHSKSTSSVLLPHAGIGLVILAGTISTLMIAIVVIRLIREIVLEPPLTRPHPKGGRGPFVAGMLAAVTSLLIGIVPQLVLRPLKSMEMPRTVVPETQERGSGKNHSAFRMRSHDDRRKVEIQHPADAVTETWLGQSALGL